MNANDVVAFLVEIGVLVLGAGCAGFVVLPTGWGVAVAVPVVLNLVLMQEGPMARHSVS